MRVLVTGATGFIGQALVPRLVNRADTAVSILVIDSPTGPLPPTLAAFRPQLNVVYGDLRNFNLTARALRECEPDAVINLAAVGATDPFLPVDTAVRNNLTGTLNLLRACFEKNRSVRQFITARTPGERTAMNHYAASKAAAWVFCQMYGRTRGWPIHGAMIFQAYGPDQPENALVPAAMAAACTGQDFPMTAGTQRRDWIYVNDVAAGLTALLDKNLPPDTTVELGTGTATSVADVVAEIYQIVGGSGRPRPGLLPSRPGEVPAQIANAAQTQALIGWRAQTTLTDGLQRTVQRMKDEE